MNNPLMKFFPTGKDSVFSNIWSLKGTEMVERIDRKYYSLSDELRYHVKSPSSICDGVLHYLMKDISEYFNKSHRYIINSELLCEIYDYDLKKIPDMNGINIPRIIPKSSIIVDIINTSKKDGIVNMGTLFIMPHLVRNGISIGDKIMDNVMTYLYNPSLKALKNYKKTLDEEGFINALKLRDLIRFMEMIDIPYYQKKCKIRINKNQCRLCPRINNCPCEEAKCTVTYYPKSFEDVMNAGRIYVTKHNDPDILVRQNIYINKKCSLFSNEKDGIAHASFYEGPTPEVLINLSRYILYMYATKNREEEELHLQQKEKGQRNPYEIKNTHVQPIKNFEKWHDLPEIRIIKYKGEEVNITLKNLGGHHASPVSHERRGHYRHLKSGKVVWVRECTVNPEKKVEKKQTIYRIHGNGVVKK